MKGSRGSDQSRRARRLPNCRFQPGAAESLALPDGAFDVVASSLMVHHLPEEARLGAVREMRRVLRPGGGLLLADFRSQSAARGACSVRSTAPGPCSAGPAPEPLVAEPHFTELHSGDAAPRLRYVRATKPEWGLI
jgi:ubiquinone/menaquinone biosynthesis C-methylase UbiE